MLVVGLWVVLLVLLALAVRNLAWLATWLNGLLFGCLFVCGVLIGFSLLAAAVHLSADTLRGRYPYPHGESPVVVPLPARTTLEKENSSQLRTGDTSAALPLSRAPSRKSAVWRVGEGLAIVVITGVLTLVLLEIGLRLFAPQIGPEMRGDPLRGLYTLDLATTYRNKPGAHVDFQMQEAASTFDINSQGLRESRDIGSSSPGKTRLLCLGDSFTFGWAVGADQAYPHLLNTVTLESVNAGVNGYGTDNEAAWLQSYGWALKPNVVLVGLFVGNDVRDVMVGRGKTSVDSQGHLVLGNMLRPPADIGQEPPPATGLDAAKSWLAHNSQAYVFLRRLSHDMFSTASETQVQKPTLYDTAPFYYKPVPSDIEEGWKKATGLLDAMRADARAHGAELVVVAIPAREQVEESYWKEIQQRFGLAESQLERDLPQRKLAEWSSRTGTPLIDLLPAFRAAPHDKPLYYRLDPHWNAAGHALAAQVIRAELARLGLINDR